MKDTELLIDKMTLTLETYMNTWNNFRMERLTKVGLLANTMVSRK